jgi:DNA-binding NarL/FixJ family response regulator
MIRLLFASPDADSRRLFDAILRAALEMTPLEIDPAHADDVDDLLRRVDARAADVLVLDWSMAHEGTPDLVRELLQRNPQLRLVALLPLTYRQYRREVWQAGACSSIAKEHIDQEWLSSVLCIMQRAMLREAQLHAFYRGSATAPADASCCAAPAEGESPPQSSAPQH